MGNLFAVIRKTPGFLLLIGVDNMRAINLKNGRDFGDGVLHDVSLVMKDEIPKRQTYRINGDWFAVNLPHATREQIAAAFNRIQERMSGQCTMSAGCVSYTDYQMADENVLLQYAEVALEQAKSQGKNKLAFFTAEDYEKKLRELKLREDLRQNVLAGFTGFSLDYQGQFYSETYQLYGAEALLRYTSPVLGPIPSEEIIPVLEQSGLICPVGMWALKKALVTCRKWRQDFPDFHISVNMSYRQLDQHTIEDDVLDLVKNSGIPGSALTIEVTESMELSNYSNLNDCFQRWKQAGIEISVDDFGTGYSSLGRLKEMAVDEVKIDRCFVQGIQNSAYNYRLLRNIIELADSSQIRVCCEGVENTAELDVLDELHPSLLQGYLFSKPLDEKTFEAQFITTDHAEKRKQLLHRFAASQDRASGKATESAPVEVERSILNAENDIFYLADLDTHELYYLNPAGQKVFGVKKYQGKKCYKVLHGKDAPCDFCTNSLLRQDSFYVWENQNEYCGRHFLLKDKLIPYQGKKVRLEVALDITKQEYISQFSQERLAFADQIIHYMQPLSLDLNYPETVNRILTSIGDFYQADRAYLFEANPTHKGHWDNTFEWCALNIPSRKEKLQNLSPESLTFWMQAFQKNKSIILANLASLQEKFPADWKQLQADDIQRLIAVPIRENDQIIGIVGVDNPRYCMHDDTQIRVLASFLLARIRQEHNERRYQTLLESNQDLMRALQVGFWTLEINKKSNTRFMTVDPIMEQMLDIPADTTPEKSYAFWQARIMPASMQQVKQTFAQMIQTGQLAQTDLLWQHPQKGKISLHLSGILIEDLTGYTKLKGYCRVLS